MQQLKQTSNAFGQKLLMLGQKSPKLEENHKRGLHNFRQAFLTLNQN